MFRSLHRKLVLVLVLLIVSVMAVVGTFLINSVTQPYYTDCILLHGYGIRRLLC